MRNQCIGSGGMLLIGMLWAVACSPDHEAVGPSADPPSSISVLVSNPVSIVAQSAARPDLGAQGSIGAGEVVYVSQPTDAIPGGTSVSIQNTTTGVTTATGMLNGGFDPVSVEATAGDTLGIVIAFGDGSESPVFWARVPAESPPVVVRTEPRAGKRDVPLNAIIVIVFSEPIDTSSVNGLTVQLRRGTTVAAGAVRVTGTERLRVEFRPDTLLAPNTDYELVVTRGITDLDGDTLQEAVNAPFTTGSPPPTGSIAVSVTTTGAGAGTVPYSVEVDGAVLGSVEVNGTTSIPGILEGARLVRLRSVPLDCSVADSNPQTVTVTSGNTTAAGFTVTCRPLTKLAFVRNGQIFSVNSDGSGLAQLTPGPADDDPAWSPDGQRIAFVRGASGGYSDIYIMNADGSSLVRRTSGDNYYQAPTWSPDGLRIGFAALGDTSGTVADGGGSFNVYEMSAADDGAGWNTVVARQGQELQPAWDPTGTWIAFASDWTAFDFSADVYLASRDGSQLIQLTNGFGFPTIQYFHPAWSPDGQRFAVQTCVQGGGSNCAIGPVTVSVMNADGSGLRELIPTTDDPSPAWSPDGFTIAVSSFGDIRWIRADGSDQGVLITNGHSPAWGR